ncbi:uncharacterized protein LOC101857679 [Aplysia californica]|uniref:Uncharacterized protein LOC101857679 n=1 Tax=Aplysia californica TaxID=6500 RepID=A0ABM0K5V0_APLCA|nr:uncharacterized protein LOC101857679 [Aplysia californica]
MGFSRESIQRIALITIGTFMVIGGFMSIALVNTRVEKAVTSLKEASNDIFQRFPVPRPTPRDIHYYSPPPYESGWYAVIFVIAGLPSIAAGVVLNKTSCIVDRFCHIFNVTCTLLCGISMGTYIIVVIVFWSLLDSSSTYVCHIDNTLSACSEMMDIATAAIIVLTVTWIANLISFGISCFYMYLNTKKNVLSSDLNIASHEVAVSDPTIAS